MTWSVSWRDHEAGAAFTPLDWDTVFDTSVEDLAFDWALAPQDGRPDAGGLNARAAISTAVILSLFCDAKAPDGWRPDVVDRRGWWADGLLAPAEEPFGSWLWTVLEQGVATPATARDAQIEAERALAWMVRDGVAGTVSVVATAVPAERRLDLSVTVAAPSGAVLWSGDFSVLWRQVI